MKGNLGQERVVEIWKALARTNRGAFERGEDQEIMEQALTMAAAAPEGTPAENILAYRSAVARASYGGKIDFQQASEMQRLWGGKNDLQFFAAEEAGFSNSMRDSGGAAQTMQRLNRKVYDKARGAGYTGSGEGLEAWLRSDPSGQAVLNELMVAATTEGTEEFSEFGGQMGAAGGGRGKGYVATLEYLRGIRGVDNPTTRAIAAARQKIRTFDDPQLMAEEAARAAEASNSTAQGALRVHRGFELAGEKALDQSPVGAERGFIRDELFGQKNLAKLGLGAFSEKIDKADFDLRTRGARTPQEVDAAAIKVLESLEKRTPRTDMDDPEYFGRGGVGEIISGRFWAPRSLTQQEQQKYNADPSNIELNKNLRELIEVMRARQHLTVDGPNGEHVPATMHAAQAAGQKQ
jgi:hypothetical protein